MHINTGERQRMKKKNANQQEYYAASSYKYVGGKQKKTFAVRWANFRQKVKDAFRVVRPFMHNLGIVTRKFITRLKRKETGAIVGVCLVGAIVLGLAGLITIAAVRGASSRGTVGNGGDASAVSVAAVDITPAPTAAPPTPTPLLIEPGTEDELIKEIQQRLMDLGYMDHDEPTAKYGPFTEEAVTLFQRSIGIETTGVLDETTYNALNSEDAPHYLIKIGIEGTDVKEMQKRLRELDYLSSATGYYGSDTEAAVKEFQTRNKLTADGMAGETTLELLYSEDAIPYALSLGVKSDDVKTYQQRLYKLGYLTTEPDGTFGRDTKNAVQLFQQLNGLIADGYIGPSTRTLLMSEDAQANAMTIGLSGNTVERVQKRLKELGYLRKVTGYYGSDTDGAVRAFQKENKLSVDGKVGKNTMKVLMSDSAKKYSGTAGDSGTQGSSSGSSGGSSGGSSSGSYGYGADALISVALSKLGCKYVRAGKGPNTFDCSGLVYYCLKQAGVSQGYLTSYGWRTVGKYQKVTSLSSLKKGDIIVFYGHVAIAVGDGTMIDASSGNGKVVHRSCTTDWCKSKFICAWRIF